MDSDQLVQLITTSASQTRSPVAASYLTHAIESIPKLLEPTKLIIKAWQLHQSDPATANQLLQVSLSSADRSPLGWPRGLWWDTLHLALATSTNPLLDHTPLAQSLTTFFSSSPNILSPPTPSPTGLSERLSDALAALAGAKARSPDVRGLHGALSRLQDALSHGEELTGGDGESGVAKGKRRMVKGNLDEGRLGSGAVEGDVAFLIGDLVS